MKLEDEERGKERFKDATLQILKMEEGDHEPSNAGVF